MEQHDIVVVGGGAAGLVVAFGAASAGADVGLIEANRIGGDCTWSGCIPSKTLIDASRRVHHARNSGHLGIQIEDLVVDFPALMSHIQSVSEAIAAEEGPQRLAEAGVRLHRSFARFVDPHTLTLEDGSAVTGKRIVLATGGRPRIPEALTGVRHLTSESVWQLSQLPEHLIVVGGGAMGCELAQAFRRLGSRVTIVTDVGRLIPGAHPDAAALLATAFENEGIDMRFDRTLISGADSDTSIRLALDDGSVLEGSHVLTATGRDTSMAGMRPDVAGIEVSADGRPILDAQLRTTEPHIFVCGDAAGAGFTHIASSQAAGVLINLFLPKAIVIDTGVERWAIFTDPEIAQVGPVPSDLTSAGASARSSGTTTRVPIERADRAAVQSATTGFIEARHSRTGRLVSVTVVGPDAAELANQWIRPVSKHSRISALAFIDTIYPTMGSTNAVIAYEWAQGLLARPIVGRLTRWAGKLRVRMMRSS